MPIHQNEHHLPALMINGRTMGTRLPVESWLIERFLSLMFQESPPRMTTRDLKTSRCGQMFLPPKVPTGVSEG